MRAEILDQKIRSIVQRERDALHELITELCGFDRIRGYQDLGYRSLFDYLTKGVGYSAGAAQRRIDAARLSKDVPDLGERLQSGALDLRHITIVSKAVRQAGKKRKISVLEKRNIIDQIEGQCEAGAQKAVAEFFDLEVITETRRSVQKNESVRYEITVTREVAEMIDRAQALISHAVPSRNLADFLEYVSQRIIHQKTQPTRARKSSAKSTATMAVDSGTHRVPQNLHRQVRNAEPRCMKCGSSWFPQTDHRRPRWAGGSNAPENLQTLCGPCNRAKYRKESNDQMPRKPAAHNIPIGQ